MPKIPVKNRFNYDVIDPEYSRKTTESFVRNNKTLREILLHNIDTKYGSDYSDCCTATKKHTMIIRVCKDGKTVWKLCKGSNKICTFQHGGCMVDAVYEFRRLRDLTVDYRASNLWTDEWKAVVAKNGGSKIIVPIYQIENEI